MESVATNKRHCKAELRAALQRALSALDFEENIHTTDSSLNKCCRDYEAASRHVETALRSGTLSILKQNLLLGCMETYKCRVEALQMKDNNCNSCTSMRTSIPAELPMIEATESNLSKDQSDSSNQLESLENLASSCLKEVNARFSDIAGEGGVKEKIMEGFLIPLRYPELFSGIQAPASNVLLHGYPGTGKTLLAEAIAGESGFKLLSVSPSTVLSKWSGESEKIIKGLFDLSRKIRPAIIFLDEIDAFGLGRSANNEISSRRILTELLVQMNKISSKDQVLSTNSPQDFELLVHVIGATNRLQDLDEALRRRFELTIEVPLPSQNSRKMIFQFYMKQANTELPCEELRYISEMTEGYSASDLKALCRVAAMRPVRELIQSLDMEQFSSSELSSIKQKMRRIDINDFQEALSQYKAARCIENGQ